MTFSGCTQVLPTQIGSLWRLDYAAMTWLACWAGTHRGGHRRSTLRAEIKSRSEGRRTSKKLPRANQLAHTRRNEPRERLRDCRLIRGTLCVQGPTESDAGPVATSKEQQHSVACAPTLPPHPPDPVISCNSPRRRNSGSEMRSLSREQ